jgi:hypothetical protein
MLGVKTIIVNIVPALLVLAAAGAYAVPFQKRGLDQVVSQCKHNFAYVPREWLRTEFPLRRLVLTIEALHMRSYTFDDGPYQWNTDLVNKFNSVGGKTTFCSSHFPIRRGTNNIKSLAVVNGKNWDCIYSEANVQALRYAFEQGHQIASAYYSCARLT